MRPGIEDTMSSTRFNPTFNQDIPEEVVNGLNILGSVPWKVNNQVMSLIEEAVQNRFSLFLRTFPDLELQNALEKSSIGYYYRLISISLFRQSY